MKGNILYNHPRLNRIAKNGKQLRTSRISVEGSNEEHHRRRRLTYYDPGLALSVLDVRVFLEEGR
jgi:hypothetical protein